jgi:hypothetical protein
MLRAYVDYLYETGRIKLVMDKGMLKYERNEDNRIVV